MSFGETESSMCLCPPGKTQHLLPKSVFDDPCLIAGTWHRPLFLTRDRWLESGSLQGRVCEPSVPESPRLRSPAAGAGLCQRAFCDSICMILTELARALRKKQHR